MLEGEWGLGNLTTVSLCIRWYHINLDMEILNVFLKIHQFLTTCLFFV